MCEDMKGAFQLIHQYEHCHHCHLAINISSSHQH